MTELAKEQAQNKVDIIMRDHAVANTGSFNSTDGEYKKGHPLIDTESRQRISVDPAAVANGKLKTPNMNPRYVIMNVTVNGEDKAVYWDHKEDKHYFDGTTQKLTAAQVSNIRTSKLPSGAERSYRISARPREGNEHLRRDFPFDQTRDSEISTRTISWIAWAGLCHNQALSESNGAGVPKSHPGHTEYVAEADREFHYNKDTLNNPFLEVPDLGTRMSDGWRTKDLGVSGYGGYRRNEEPGRITFGRLTIPRDSRRRGALSFSSVTKPDGTKVSSAEYFCEKFAVNKDPSKPDALKSEKKPNYVRTTSGDSVECKLTDCVIEAGAQFESYGSDGYMKRDSGRITLDFKNKPDTEVMVDSYRTSARNMAWEEVYVNLAKGTVTRERFHMERGSNGQYTKKSDGKLSSSFSLNGVKGVREAQIDNPQSYLPLIEKSRRTGEAVVFESADNYEIWNSYLHEIENRTLHADDANVTTRFGFDSKFGSGHAKIVYDRTASGDRKNHTGASQKGDFFWSGKHRFLAFEDGYANVGALDEGLIHRRNGVVQAPMFNDMCEIMLGAFRDAPYSVVKGGVRTFYANKTDFDAQVARQKAAYAAIGQTGGGGGGTGGIGELHRSEGSVSAKKYKRVTLPAAEADGEMTVRLMTKKGDADLYVRTGGRPTTRTNDGESENYGLDVDEVKINVKKGEKVQVGVFGWEASDYQLVVIGPKASGGNTGGGPEPVDITRSEQLARNGEETFKFKVEKDGYLKFKMDGTGDIDIYAKKNGPAVRSTRGNDWYDRGSTTDAEGRMLVKAGDEVNVLLHGWAAGQYNLRITQE